MPSLLADEALITSVCARGTFGSWFRVAAAVREARSQLKSERTEAQCRRRWARAAAEVVGEAERRAQFAVMSEDLAATAVKNWGPQIVKCSRELKEERSAMKQEKKRELDAMLEEHLEETKSLHEEFTQASSTRDGWRVESGRLCSIDILP